MQLKWRVIYEMAAFIEYKLIRNCTPWRPVSTYMDQIGAGRNGSDQYFPSRPIQVDPERILKSLKRFKDFSIRWQDQSRSILLANQWQVFLSRDFNEIQKNNNE